MSWRDDLTKLWRNVIKSNILKDVTTAGKLIDHNTVFNERGKRDEYGIPYLWGSVKPPEGAAVQTLTPLIVDSHEKNLEYTTLQGEQRKRFAANPLIVAVTFFDMLKLSYCQLVDFFVNYHAYSNETYSAYWQRVKNESGVIPGALLYALRGIGRGLLATVIPSLIFSPVSVVYWLVQGIRHNNWNPTAAFVNFPRTYVPRVLKAPVIAILCLPNIIFRTIASVLEVGYRLLFERHASAFSTFLENNKGQTIGFAEVRQFTNELTRTEVVSNVKQDPAKLTQTKFANSRIIETYANKLFAMSRNLFIAIPEGEFTNPKLYGDAARCPRMMDYTRYWNQLQRSVIEDVLSYDALPARVACFERWIWIAQRCYEKGDFNSMHAIIGGLGKTALFRLNTTKHNLSPQAKTVLANLEQLIDPRNIQAVAYKKEMSERSGPVIPFIGIFLQDLTFAKDGNDDTRLEDTTAFQNTMSTLAKCKTSLADVEVPAMDQSWNQLEDVIKAMNFGDNDGFDIRAEQRQKRLEPKKDNGEPPKQVAIATVIVPFGRDNPKVSLLAHAALRRMYQDPTIYADPSFAPTLDITEQAIRQLNTTLLRTYDNEENERANINRQLDTVLHFNSINLRIPPAVRRQLVEDILLESAVIRFKKKVNDVMEAYSKLSEEIKQRVQAYHKPKLTVALAEWPALCVNNPEELHAKLVEIQQLLTELERLTIDERDPVKLQVLANAKHKVNGLRNTVEAQIRKIQEDNAELLADMDKYIAYAKAYTVPPRPPGKPSFNKQYQRLAAKVQANQMLSPAEYQELQELNDELAQYVTAVTTASQMIDAEIAVADPYQTKVIALRAQLANNSQRFAAHPALSGRIATMHQAYQALHKQVVELIKQVSQQSKADISNRVRIPAIKQYLLQANPKIRQGAEAEAALICLNNFSAYANMTKATFVEYCKAAFVVTDAIGEIYETVKKQAKEIVQLQIIHKAALDGLTRDIGTARDVLAKFDEQEAEHWSNENQLQQLNVEADELDLAAKTNYLQLADRELAYFTSVEQKLAKLRELKTALLRAVNEGNFNISLAHLKLLAPVANMEPSLHELLAGNKQAVEALVSEIDLRIASLEQTHKALPEKLTWVKDLIERLVSAQIKQDANPDIGATHPAKLINALRGVLIQLERNLKALFTDKQLAEIAVLKQHVLVLYQAEPEAAAAPAPAPKATADIKIRRNLGAVPFVERQKVLKDIQSGVNAVMADYTDEDFVAQVNHKNGCEVQYTSPNQGQNKFMKKHGGAHLTQYDKEKAFIRDTIAAEGFDQFRKKGQQPVIIISGRDRDLLRVAYAYTLAFGFKPQLEAGVKVDETDMAAKVQRYRSSLIKDHAELYNKVHCEAGPAPQLRPPLESMMPHHDAKHEVGLVSY